MTNSTSDRPLKRGNAVWTNPKYWGTLCIASAMSTASGGTVEQAFILADPQMQVRDGAVQGCGYRLKAIPQSFDGRSPVLALDASFIFTSGVLVS